MSEEDRTIENKKPVKHREETDLVGGARAKNILQMFDGSSIADDVKWVLAVDKQGCEHLAPLYGEDHWEDSCPCHPIVENGQIVHRARN